MSNEFDNKRLKRLYVLDRLLKDKEGYTREKLCRIISQETEEEYNRFALKRDLDLLKGCLGREISYKSVETIDEKNMQKRCVDKIRYAEGTPSLFTLYLTDEQKEHISTAMGVMGLKGLDNTKMFRGLDLAVKSKNLLISYTVNPREKAIGNLFYALYRAAKDKEMVTIRMRDRKDHSVKTHKVHPWYLREYNRRWYLFGYDEGKKGVMHYALDRIVGKPKPYESRMEWQKPVGNIETILKDVIGISIPDSQPIEVIFWVSNESADFVENKPMHHSQQKLEPTDPRVEPYLARLPEGGAFFRLFCINNYELRREMISFGPELIVVSPVGLQAEVKGQLERMVANYNTFING